MLQSLKSRASTIEQKRIADIINLLNATVNDDGAIKSIRLQNDPNCGQVICKEITISAADIVATGTGKLGNANGVQLVPNPGTDYIVDLIDAILIYDYAGAGYGAGGNLTINETGGAALTGLVSAANSLGSASDKIISLVPLSTVGIAKTLNKGLSLVSSAAFTAGSATGVVRVHIEYRVHKVGLV